jgi:NAD(P)H-hydrate epimerase
VVDWLPALSAPCVLDADGLTLVAEGAGGLSALRQSVGPRVLTPHPGEVARLLGATASEVQADRYGAALQLAEQSGQVAVLKGAGTVVASPDGQLRVCPHGSPAMGTGGTGDVLAGVIGALLASGLPALDAASAGVLWHALAGERAATGDRGLLASELANALPAALSAACRG